ncbi:HD domain-containing protein [Tetragenococcus koreensis]|uniref:HD domain-containing protein n=1 Tax=Tetragenococcus koreensis TaxID=290335 RepID=UPI001F328FA7|nr:HD domain-containing protein [Tetragenococcus koreensis]MCF1584010.1 HD domain-containing protein [Tetragenococcus koreensis]MCF1613471.1 HD domain-containing protein [Tetragenococcus koreensis]MCF1618790.1 HD domain-containing protein [Tetragenococcus koreensis]MCF1623318.1 HD domain-containing protein [Tetragenococcus koreensis]MCF1628248.1 HD domain-containing protein [Tetragenococcus koreensis]
MSVPYKYQTLPIEKVFRDPVHNYIHIDHQVILDLINSKEVQRLRRIKQLGTSSFTFHGAEHSRFSHSLGVYEITRRICNIFQQNYSIEKIGEDGWDDSQRLIALCAALLHDVGHGPYSHTFEHIFHTDHEEITVAIITSPETEVYQILNRVEAGFPEKVASIITKTYPNPQVVQMISSQIDADRMDYLLRDAYFTGTKYGTFDLTRILRVIRPYKNGIAFAMNGMHAVEDYIVSRYQMYVQVYFHPSSRGMEVVLEHLLNRAHDLFPKEAPMFQSNAQLLVPFFKENFSLNDYLRLDDGVLNTAFNLWTELNDPILSDLANRFLNRKPLKSCRFEPGTQGQLIDTMKQIVEKAGFNPEYYTALNSSYDLPYDFYQPKLEKHRTQIELQQNDGTLVELSQISHLVAALAGQEQGDHRFYFPKEMIDPRLQNDSDLFGETYRLFASHIYNGALI